METSLYTPGFLSTAQHDALLQHVNCETWDATYPSRRQQVYGARGEPLPAWAAQVAGVCGHHAFARATVVEFLPGCGYEPRTEHGHVAILPLGSPCIVHAQEKHFAVDAGGLLLLPPGAKHGVPGLHYGHTGACTLLTLFANL